MYHVNRSGVEFGKGGLEYLDIIGGGYVGVLLLDFAAMYFLSLRVTWAGGSKQIIYRMSIYGENERISAHCFYSGCP